MVTGEHASGVAGQSPHTEITHRVNQPFHQQPGVETLPVWTQAAETEQKKTNPLGLLRFYGLGQESHVPVSTFYPSRKGRDVPEDGEVIRPPAPMEGQGCLEANPAQCHGGG